MMDSPLVFKDMVHYDLKRRQSVNTTPRNGKNQLTRNRYARRPSVGQRRIEPQKLEPLRLTPVFEPGQSGSTGRDSDPGSPEFVSWVGDDNSLKPIVFGKPDEKIVKTEAEKRKEIDQFDLFKSYQSISSSGIVDDSAFKTKKPEKQKIVQQRKGTRDNIKNTEKPLEYRIPNGKRHRPKDNDIEKENKPTNVSDVLQNSYLRRFAAHIDSVEKDVLKIEIVTGEQGDEHECSSNVFLPTDIPRESPSPETIEAEVHESFLCEIPRAFALRSNNIVSTSTPEREQLVELWTPGPCQQKCSPSDSDTKKIPTEGLSPIGYVDPLFHPGNEKPAYQSPIIATQRSMRCSTLAQRNVTVDRRKRDRTGSSFQAFSHSGIGKTNTYDELSSNGSKQLENSEEWKEPENETDRKNGANPTSMSSTSLPSASEDDEVFTQNEKDPGSGMTESNRIQGEGPLRNKEDPETGMALSIADESRGRSGLLSPEDPSAGMEFECDSSGQKKLTFSVGRSSCSAPQSGREISKNDSLDIEGQFVNSSNFPTTPPENPESLLPDEDSAVLQRLVSLSLDEDTSTSSHLTADASEVKVRNFSRLEVAGDGTPYYVKGKDQERTPMGNLLAVCEQSRLLAWEEAFSAEMIKKVEKIGEGVYGEVFRSKYSKSKDSVAIKVIPIEGTFEVNGTAQKSFEEILPEVVIAKEMSGLRKAVHNQTPNFVEVVESKIIAGAYPRSLKRAWNHYAATKGTENDNPSVFGDEQLFLVFVFGDGGCDLENFKIQNDKQASSIAIQVLLALSTAEMAMEFEHRDLHIGNVLVKETKKESVAYRIEGKDMEVKTHGVEVFIIDFTNSRLKKHGCYIYFDLSTDQELFEGPEDERQFEVYRIMQRENRKEWRSYNPHSNVLWWHYLIDKLVKLKKFPGKRLKGLYSDLKQSLPDIVLFQSCSEIVEKNLFWPALSLDSNIQ